MPYLSIASFTELVMLLTGFSLCRDEPLALAICVRGADGVEDDGATCRRSVEDMG